MTTVDFITELFYSQEQQIEKRSQAKLHQVKW